MSNEGSGRKATDALEGLSGALNAKILIRLLERQTRARDKIFLILDNLRVHRSRLVCEWLEANAKKIEVI